jgi:RNA polymerase sigma-70 factor (ECF subfamily)
MDVNGRPGVAGSGPEGRLLTIFTLDIADGRVQAVRAVVNPDKLARAAGLLRAPPGRGDGP